MASYLPLGMEHALNKYTKYNNIAIPYWDSSLDFDLADPTTSEIFTSKYFGTSRGKVGAPFNWKTSSNEDLVRNIGATASLISKEFVKRVLSRRYHGEITNEKKPEYFLEGYHNGPHLWCDGQMGILSQSAEDPLFWCHHAYIDMLWQKFREQQMSRGVKPFNDYPDVQGLHNANEPMDPFRVSNRNGYSEFWIENYYRYEPSPNKCSANYLRQQDYLNTQCGTQNLVCDYKLGRCVAKGGQTGKRPSVLPTLRLDTRFPFEKRFVDSRTSGIQVPLKKKYGKRPRPSGRPVVPLAELLDFINDHDPHRRWKRSVHSDSFDAARRMCLEVKKHA
ncbi:hypothetical protein KUTeg_019088 [Tegillarca granosa]|uniref:Tyrosinase copper-binding domain-containing protein n=1 Tax=Tegillarca granosa TaxID=220873 RepID=A0ABQ9EBI8_TEGGR|nr:hypothetical protein KUTeg_019088 [Tegillarca granosa]